MAASTLVSLANIQGNPELGSVPVWFSQISLQINENGSKKSFDRQYRNPSEVEGEKFLKTLPPHVVTNWGLEAEDCHLRGKASRSRKSHRAWLWGR